MCLVQTTDECKDESDEPVKPVLKTVQVNYIGVIYTAKLAMHYFNKQDESRDRCLIIKGSLASYLDLPGGAEYQSSKFGVRGLMCCLRNSNRMRVNLLAPWWARTGIMPEAHANYVDDMLKRIGSQWIHLEDAGKAAMRIATDESIQGGHNPNSCPHTQLIPY
jgi:NAD(P)-dependent dehydrogenase (short-subunit alcohol dehydrogenase family)